MEAGGSTQARGLGAAIEKPTLSLLFLEEKPALRCFTFHFLSRI